MQPETLRVPEMNAAMLACATAAILAAAPVGAKELPTLITYDIPQPLLYSHHIDDFTVRVRQPGEAWRDLYEYRVMVDQDTHSAASVVMFDFTGKVEIAVRKNNGDVHRVAVRPGNPPVRLQDGVAFITLDRPANLSVEFDGDRLHNLHILAGAPIERPPATPDTVFYEAGLHVPADGSGYFPVRSNQTIYVAGGAVLQGTFAPREVENVRILGRGIIDRPQEQLVVQSSRNVTVEGLTFLTPLHGTIACSMSRDVRFRDIRTFSDGQWSDGINVFACTDVSVDRAFVRTSDDSVAIYATRKSATGDTQRVTVSHSTFWPDVAHAMFVGLHGDHNVVSDIAFDDIDVLDHDEDDPEYQGVMAISAGDSNTVRNVRFSNVRVDAIEEGRLFNVRVVFNSKYSFSPGRSVENVIFRDISFTGAGWASPSIVAGYDAERRVRNVSFENIRIGGRRMTRPEGWLEVGAFADQVAIR